MKFVFGHRPQKIARPAKGPALQKPSAPLKKSAPLTRNAIQKSAPLNKSPRKRFAGQSQTANRGTIRTAIHETPVGQKAAVIHVIQRPVVLQQSSGAFQSTPDLFFKVLLHLRHYLRSKSTSPNWLG